MKRLVLPALLLLAGCGGGDKTTKPVLPSDGLPAGTPAADSPTHLIQRFEATWEYEVEAQYALLLTDDFRFKFSAAADPELVDRYPNWGRVDDIASTTHLFDGFENSTGTAVPGASHIDLTLTGVSQGPDFDHADSTAQYQKIVATVMFGEITVPVPPDEIVYSINARQEFFLVRGDAAVLPTGVAADTTRWYIRRWEDVAAPPPGIRKGPVINPASATTYGKVKASYR